MRDLRNVNENRKRKNMLWDVFLKRSDRKREREGGGEGERIIKCQGNSGILMRRGGDLR